MASNLDRYKADLDRLIWLADDMLLDLHFQEIEGNGKLNAEHEELKKKLSGAFQRHYQKWYTESLAVVRQLIPDRLAEFEDLYKGDGRRKEVNAVTYNIQDWLMGVRAAEDYTGEKRFNDFAAASMRMDTQAKILKSAAQRFESSLFDIRQLVQADLFDSELDAARELLKHKFLRAAGAIAGVVVEKHLAQVAANHQVVIRKQHPTIADLNDPLKAAGVIDTPLWRNIQRLADLRNLCDHSKNREPTSDEVGELIDGVDKLVKTLF